MFHTTENSSAISVDSIEIVELDAVSLVLVALISGVISVELINLSINCNHVSSLHGKCDKT